MKEIPAIEVKKLQKAAGISETSTEGSGIVISIPEDVDYKEFAKAVAAELKEGYGPHLYKQFLQALVAELK